MELNEYQLNAMKYRMKTADEMYALLGLSGEVGELHSMVAKAIRDGVKDDEEFDKLLMKELGDVLWFVAAIASDMEISLEKVGQANIDKLLSRNKRGKIGGSGNDR
jgi:NTP pyrophosphatase (non-canonical NTP hydrolase)